MYQPAVSFQPSLNATSAAWRLVVRHRADPPSARLLRPDGSSGISARTDIHSDDDDDRSAGLEMQVNEHVRALLTLVVETENRPRFEQSTEISVRRASAVAKISRLTDADRLALVNSTPEQVIRYFNTMLRSGLLALLPERDAVLRTWTKAIVRELRTSVGDRAANRMERSFLALRNATALLVSRVESAAAEMRTDAFAERAVAAGLTVSQLRTALRDVAVRYDTLLEGRALRRDDLMVHVPTQVDLLQDAWDAAAREAGLNIEDTRALSPWPRRSQALERYLPPSTALAVVPGGTAELATQHRPPARVGASEDAHRPDVPQGPAPVAGEVWNQAVMVPADGQAPDLGLHIHNRRDALWALRTAYVQRNRLLPQLTGTHEDLAELSAGIFHFNNVADMLVVFPCATDVTRLPSATQPEGARAFTARYPFGAGTMFGARCPMVDGRLAIVAGADDPNRVRHTEDGVHWVDHDVYTDPVVEAEKARLTGLICQEAFRLSLQVAPVAGQP